MKIVYAKVEEKLTGLLFFQIVVGVFPEGLKW
jgi:hypothetical protein